jgi:hypothetical protein
LTAAVRIAARVEMPLGRITSLLRTAYFMEYRRRFPRDLAIISEKLDVSIRTAGTLNRQLKDDFFAPETRVEPLRQVTAALLVGVETIEDLMAQTNLEEPEVRRTVNQLVQVGWAKMSDSGALSLEGTLRSFVTEDVQRRVDGVNHQMAIIADSVWETFVAEDRETAGARSWSFAARPEALAAAMARMFETLRLEAIALEEDALDSGIHDRFGITVAVSPVKEEQ